MCAVGRASRLASDRVGPCMYTLVSGIRTLTCSSSCTRAAPHMYTVGAFTINNYSHTQDQELTLTTFTSLSIANEPPGMLRLGDRGDAPLPARRPPQAALRPHKRWPRSGLYPVWRQAALLYEQLKCSTPFHVSPALGLGSTDKGGAASTADGGRFATWATRQHRRSPHHRQPRRKSAFKVQGLRVGYHGRRGCIDGYQASVLIS